jgi:nifR3 family TIM-barrel protein
MSKNFWKKLSSRGGSALGGKKPIMILAPMANVTDAAFRPMIAKYGKPDIMYTEFVSCDGLMSEGRERLMIDLKYSEAERPIIAQIFGSKPENFKLCAELMVKLGFDGIDINMGCPDRSVEKQGAGANLIKTPALARAIIRATKEGANDLPVSVKTRLGYNKITLDEWLPELLAEKPSAVIIHARTRKEMSKVPAHWDEMKRAVEIRDAFCHPKRSEGSVTGSDSSATPQNDKTLIIGNGDVLSLEEAHRRVKETGVDGVMFGRGIFGNPWLFKKGKKSEQVPVEERFKVIIEHTYLFEKYFQGVKSFDVMKKHYKAYINNFDGAKELRMQLMEKAKSASDVEKIIKEFKS